ncbi:hypothetical protein HZA97_02670 [Candidatus Woesearchaeota archaeon]|nr:hypothetical protein [Candidatus Woesearchaeota archaeon]
MIDKPAKKLRIIDVLSSQYVKEEGLNPNYLIVNGEKVYCVNIVGVIVGIRIEENEADIDDGTGLILVKNFGERLVFNNLKVGDLVLIIAKPRECGGKYLMPEVVKKTSEEWLKLRKEELKDNPSVESKDEIKFDKNKRLLNRIKELDDGAGAPVDLLISEDPENEKRIRELLVEGEIFQLSPDRIKVLE